MTEQEWQLMKEVCIISGTIKGEVNRMCETDDLAELDTMALHARKNIERLQKMRYDQLKGASK